MQYMINGLGELAVQFSFENGWTVNIARLECKHVTFAIIPTYIAENEKFGRKLMEENIQKYGMVAMRKRGDYIDHFDGTDDELIALLVGVRLRPTEAHLAKVGQDIMKAVKS